MNRRSTDSITVLHAEDDPDFATMAKTFIEKKDDRLAVETVANADEGLSRLDEADFDCIVSDYTMPGLNGIEFLEAIRKEYRELPFILFTGKGSEEVASTAISVGVTDYIQKSSQSSQYALLANKIVNAVEAADAEQAQRQHLRAIENAQEGISIINEDNTFSYVNQAYADLYGYTPEEMVGKPFSVTYPEGALEVVQADVIPTLEEVGFWHGETTGLRTDGSTFVEDHTLAKTDEGEVICSVRDKTESKTTQQAIEGLHATADALMQADTDEEVADITVAAARNIEDFQAISVHRYDSQTDTLNPLAWTDPTEDLLGEIPTYHPPTSTGTRRRSSRRRAGKTS